MKSLTGRVATLFAVGMLAAIVPATAMAAPTPKHTHPPKHGHVGHSRLIFGTPSAYIAGSTIAVTPETTGAVATTVKLTAKTKVVGTSTGATDVAVDVHTVKGVLIGSAIRFAAAPFAVGPWRAFSGTCVSVTTTSPTQLVLKPRKGSNLTFNWDTKTRFLPKKVAPKANDRLLVLAREYTNSSWYAKAVLVLRPKK